ncbi:MAG: hypothetical protein ACT4PI_10215 [Actinomycetota bacterium]
MGFLRKKKKTNDEPSWEELVRDPATRPLAEQIANSPDTLRNTFNIGVALCVPKIEELLEPSEEQQHAEACLFFDPQAGQGGGIGYLVMTDSRFLWAAADPRAPWDCGAVPRSDVFNIRKRTAQWEEWIPTVPLENGPTLRPVAREEFGGQPTDLEITVTVDKQPVSLRMLIDEKSVLPDQLVE